MSLGIPQNLPARLRKALAKELKEVGATYQEIAQSADPPLGPADVLKMARAWNSLTPAQKAAWHDYARQQNMDGGDLPSRN